MYVLEAQKECKNELVRFPAETSKEGLKHNWIVPYLENHGIQTHILSAGNLDKASMI